MKTDLRSLTLNELEAKVLALNESKFRAKQIFSQVQKKGASSFDKMTELSHELREKLSQHFQISTLKTIKVLTATDGTKKYLFELPDRLRIEAVLLIDKDRRTICLSTQVGCRMKCVFCATGKMQFKRNLTAGEIVSQVIQIEAENGRISNLVYMGMGEPLDNYDEVLKSIRILIHPLGKNIGQRKITVSTCGLIPEINRLAQEKLQIRLAVALNGANDKIRSELMPINKKYPLRELIPAIKNFVRQTNRRVTIEYVLIGGQNDSPLDADALANLIRGIKVNINLIPCNPFPKSTLKRTTVENIKEFKKILEDIGFEVAQRYRRGESIAAACGQLAG
ncbi:MAG: 23S rRNA (adenine(2503)-C(2))-methyltransferase RlmN [Candidatus Margulisbacteria bacterium]|nr:23S rRNA (adenine(2503)-C(2))-methyltransferase RlmN [Candidatus Margulisiibacteriota bacterium]MBU1021803.1 23S rRNA (adenine(2503)-C(2))-methyltransferase RlmN [Candidatus Margulisiibacteriota bacterium]MBU1729268.1 23S rRNA (adenine(2503)-C(2))-methyltransferase RlmN [Candidatus Margulisiibacteriota bacterium]MBU1955541.1 23S rRNA (adenine(2503)-C(2))-methyltransferase RlmN [Candidatus Margulisiibacteriota bacterium]